MDSIPIGWPVVIAGFLIPGSTVVIAALAALLFRRTAAGIGLKVFLPGLALLVIGVVLILTQQEDLVEAHRKLRWPSVQGEVVVSKVVGKRAFHPHIEYEYAVDGRTFHDSTTLDLPSFGGRRSKYDAAEYVAGQYPAGKKVTVHYDPKNPAESKLRVFPSWAVYGKMSVGVLMLAFGVFSVIGFFMKRPGP